MFMDYFYDTARTETYSRTAVGSYINDEVARIWKEAVMI
jgi:hypothetical protein